MNSSRLHTRKSEHAVRSSKTVPRKTQRPGKRAEKKRCVHVESGAPPQSIKWASSQTEIRKETNQKLHILIRHMSTVIKFIETVSALRAKDRICKQLLKALRSISGFDAGAVYMYNETKKLFSEKHIYAYKPRAILQFRNKLGIDERLYNWIFDRGQAIMDPESFTHPRAGLKRHWIYMIAPLGIANECLGRVELLFNKPRQNISPQTTTLIDVLLKHTAAILANEKARAQEEETAKRYIELDLLKQDVITTTTHEIKTPLTIIQAASMLLERNNNLSPNRNTQLLNRIIRNCKRISHIMENLFEVARFDDNTADFKQETVSLAQITKKVLKDLRDKAKGVNFKTLFGSELSPLQADRSHIYKAIRNLVENAITYSPLGGSIEIQARNAGDQIVWQIKDHGFGIADHDQKHIFDKFYRAGNSTTRLVRGMGLGLYLTKKYIEINYGKIYIQSRLNKGSTFILVFPKKILF